MIFLPLRKVDVAQRLIYARLDETPDRAGHVLDYLSSKPEFEKWSEEMRKASGGKSLGNIRAMHQLKAAGKVEAIAYDDQAKAIEICAKIVDDDEWKKVEEGVYTGISPGGRFLKRWNDGPYMRYTAGPNEISLADLPTIPSATFTMVKTDGGVEERPFRPALADEIAALTEPEDYRALILAQPSFMVKALFPSEELMKIAATRGLQKREFSSVEREAMAKRGEALPDGSFPIASKADLENAIDAFGRAKDKGEAKAHIIKRAKELDATELLPADWEGSTKKMAKVASIGTLRKSLSDVGQLAGLLQGLCWFTNSIAAEAASEGDGSPLPARAAAAVSELTDILTSLVSEESKEALAQLTAAVAAIPAFAAAAASAGPVGLPTEALAKVGARNSKADQEHIQAIHNHAVGAGADCSAMAKTDDLGPLAKVAGDLSLARGTLRKLAGENDALKKRVAVLEKLPVSGGPLRTQAVDRRNDTGGTRIASEVEKRRQEIEAQPNGPDKTLALIRFAMENPQPPR